MKRPLTVPLTPEDIAFRKWIRQNTKNDNQEFYFPVHDANDWDLLTHLVQQHQPLPTPLHPRAVPRGQPLSVATRRAHHHNTTRWLRSRCSSATTPTQFMARAFPQHFDGGSTVHQLLPRVLQEADTQLVASTLLRRDCRVCVLTTKTHKLRCLRRASRGNWGTRNGLWLQPHERWFPLSMYLAHCYEQHLRHVFRRQQQQQHVDTDILLSSSNHVHMEERLLQQATVRALRQCLVTATAAVTATQQKKQQLSLRKGVLWDLLHATSRTTTTTPLSHCRILDIGTPRDQWTTLVYQEWHTLWADQQAFLLGESSSPPTPGKKRKKKRKKGKTNKTTTTHTNTETTTTTSAVLGTVEENTEQVDDDDDDDNNSNDEGQGTTPVMTERKGPEAAATPITRNGGTTTTTTSMGVPIQAVEDDDDDDGSFQKVERTRRSKHQAAPTTTTPKLLFRKPKTRPPPKVVETKIPQKQPQRDVVVVPPPVCAAPQQTPPGGPPSLSSAEYYYPQELATEPNVYAETGGHGGYRYPEHVGHYGGGYPEHTNNGGGMMFSLPLIQDPSATIRTSNVVPHRDDHTSSFDTGFGVPTTTPNQQYYNPWEIPGLHSPFPQNSLPHRNESILSELFDDQRRNEKDLSIMSTAASIASSSSDKISDYAMDGLLAPATDEEVEPPILGNTELSEMGDEIESLQGNRDESENNVTASIGSPSPPSTPSPTLSPIFVSLSEVSAMKESIDRLSLPERSISSETGGGVVKVNYSSRNNNIRLAASLSRDNSCSSETGPVKVDGPRPLHTRDDQEIRLKFSSPRKSVDALSSYRSPRGAARDDHDIKLRSHANGGGLTTSSSFRRAPSPAKSMLHYDKRSPRLSSLESTTSSYRKVISTSRSETALDGDDDYQNWQHEHNNTAVSKGGGGGGEEGEVMTVRTDGSTNQFEVTASIEHEALTSLREERNMYQDMCLTLGAEVAKLRTMLAAQKAVPDPHTAAVAFPRNAHHPIHPYYGGGAHPVGMFPTFPFAPRAKTLAAMSDTGYRGEHESLASEDEIGSRSKLAKSGQLSSAVTLAESDASLDQSSTHNITHHAFTGGGLTKEFVDVFSAPHQAVRSRLGQDIYQLMELVETQLGRLSPKRHSAVERVTRLVKTLWPRAQVSLYGSHATGLCVPSSDLDFVISLPAVHKKAVAVAPGALEGRNAINETSQKQLARHLKGESWIDPRSMKLIDRTFVPVIKVATKDTRAKTLHLDISFEGPGHHGLEAARMISSVVDEFPVVRPLVIVLKLLLIDRSLLESYSGGLSSYCLFLMVTRYVQEQDGGLDLGALLMGFLDYHGNHFDPRATGISVRHRMYFARLMTSRHDGASAAWRATAATNSIAAPTHHHRRNSATSENNQKPSRPKLQGTIHTQSYHAMAPVYTPATTTDQSSFDSGSMPYTFDPLFVEDPLSDGNNVGRNAFRVFQVQRAFSDAHRALVAALEWDIHSELPEEGDDPIPLLKCLFQNEGAVYDLQV